MTQIFNFTDRSLKDLKNPYVKNILARLLTIPSVFYKTFSDDDTKIFLTVFEGLTEAVDGKANEITNTLTDEQKREMNSAYNTWSGSPKFGTPIVLKANLTVIMNEIVIPHLRPYLTLDVQDKVTDTSEIGKNLEKFAKGFGLCETSKNLLQFYCHKEHNKAISKMIEEFPRAESDTERLTNLALLINSDIEDLGAIIGQQSRLFSTGILKMEENIRGISCTKSFPEISVASHFSSRLTKPAKHLNDLYGVSLEAFLDSDLSLEYFKHVPDADLIEKILKSAFENKCTGVSILFFGEPGSGKTTLAKAIFNKLGLQITSVKSEDDNGKLANNDDRVRHFHLLQQTTSTKPFGVIFDEAEYLLKDPVNTLFSLNTSYAIPKSFINNMLENNKYPTIYICNSTDDFNPAFLDRFTYVLKMPSLPKSTKVKLINKSLEGTELSINSEKDHAWLNRLAKRNISARQVKLAVETAKRIAPSETIIDVADKVIHNNHKHIVGQQDTWQPLPDFYSPDYININYTRDKLEASLKNGKKIKLLFYGATGTGKTAFAQYLLENAGLQYRIVRTSELVSCYVGETEKNIKNILSWAEQNEVVLVIDEIDSLASDRSTLEKQWQISSVNELLSALDVYQGSLIGTTNRLNGMDPAIIRRFSARIHIQPLLPKQAADLILNIAKTNNFEIDMSKEQLLHFALQNPVITPGDIAVVENRADWCEITSLTSFTNELAQEVEIKLKSKGDVTCH